MATAQIGAVVAAPICLVCGQPCLTCSPLILIEAPRHPGGRPVASGAYPTAQLRLLVLVDAERLWREGEPPTLRLVGLNIGYTADGLSRALVRRGLSWTAIRNDAYRRSFGRFMSGEVA
jgi:hypothetical protein